MQHQARFLGQDNISLLNSFLLFLHFGVERLSEIPNVGNRAICVKVRLPFIPTLKSVVHGQPTDDAVGLRGACEPRAHGHS